MNQKKKKERKEKKRNRVTKDVGIQEFTYILILGTQFFVSLVKKKRQK